MDTIDRILEQKNEQIKALEEENKNLKIKVASLEGEIKGLNYTIEKLKEENNLLEEEVEMGKINRKREKEEMKKKIQTLELWLDNKEKLNEEYRVKLDKYKKYYDRDKEELMESCYALAKENERLKSDLGECECSFGFENDEVGYWKREYKRLKKWIKDHCNGYGNLFPEDQMRKQRKKADKKRKKSDLSKDFTDDELIYEEGLYD